MILERLTLLSRDEFKQYCSLIPKVDRWWWLKTAVADHGRCVHIVDDLGTLFINSCGADSGGVRPLCVFRAELSDAMFWQKSETVLGASVKYGNYSWTVLDIKNGEIYALCDIIIDKGHFDLDTNNWNRSYLKVWLDTIGLTRITS